MSERLAADRGGEWHEYLGKDSTWYTLADLYDAISQLTQAAGNWRKKPPDIKPYSRPGDEAAAEKKKPKSLADVVRALGGPVLAPGGRLEMPDQL